MARQARTLNTNMRYVHEAAIELAERLVASMPEGSGLDTVTFVNSGSEANDLAWRIATTYTGNDGGLSSAYAYHGISSVSADLSPEGSSAPRPENVEGFPPPGPNGDGPASGYGEALTRLAERGHGPAAVFVDGAFTSDGVLPPSTEFLESIIEQTHAAGGLYVADEVQSGHGRGGEHLWSFAARGITPDMVTMGKPMGNGYPIAAIVTRSEIVDRFAELREFFSTFGGNPPGTVAALSVLDVIEDEGLIERAGRVGDELRAGIREAASSHPGVAAVRGMGQLTGVELTGAGGEPDPALADRIKNGLREHGVLVGTTGRHDNILKIRPPLPFGSEHVAIFCEAFGDALAETT
jgi:4-aminobutyrate aminotransferase-like enzyme